MSAAIRLIIAPELGFCPGVRRSIDMAMSAKARTGCDVTILGQLVHNSAVLRSLSEAGIGCVSDVKDAPSGKLLLSAHGASPDVAKQAVELGLDVIDTTCPLVAKVHRLVERLTAGNHHILIFGDPDHEEIRGIIGHGNAGMITVIRNTSELFRSVPERCALVSQTTQDIEAFGRLSEGLRRRFPGIRIHNTICKPTRRRQEAAADLARKCELVYVVGSPASANSVRLVDITKEICGRSMLIEDADRIGIEQIEMLNVIGLTAGASSPDSVIASVIRRLCELREVDLVTSSSLFEGIPREIKQG